MHLYFRIYFRILRNRTQDIRSCVKLWCSSFPSKWYWPFSCDALITGFASIEKVEMEANSGASEPNPNATITINVKFSGVSIPISISPNSTIKDLKSLLLPSTNVLPRGQKLIFKGFTFFSLSFSLSFSTHKKETPFVHSCWNQWII